MASGEEDRRQHPRFLCAGEAEIRSLPSGYNRRGKISNLSLSGCLLDLGKGHSFIRAEAVEMTFTVRQLPVRVQGAIGAHHGETAVGVEFTLLTERGKLQLLQLIQELAEIIKNR